jgi:predicted nucleotidyltransferase
MPSVSERKTLRLSWDVPVEERADVLVEDGGSAGIAAATATAAARNGARTVLVEKYGFLGGTSTAGLVGPFMTSYSADGKEPVLGGIFQEVVDRMAATGGAIDPGKTEAGEKWAAYIRLGHAHVTPVKRDASRPRRVCDALSTMEPATRTLSSRLAACLEPRGEILEAYLFGSTATGSAQAHSDVDVAVYLDEPRPATSTFGYAAELSTTLMRALGVQRVDVVVLNDAPPLLYHRVLRDGVRVLSRDLRATTTREGYALSRYCDYAVQLAKIDAVHRARIDAGRFGR